ncbi:MAG: oxygen-independent coproporphyrinogen III oxidase [Phenylobacterium sp.]|uniref:oxygen-independent coproporphyrinogen III oxidase n=1 Tax=Phenylobacterium sp. TaxID=1871053 RepID=UPI001B3D6660|nr:oxygen-independent coproporphyrinogen III oxidase [Phenylobacterium sp.]MBP7817377.1 oxygen-independent coproporphyrinogen III oxidase [Phenylobacterium sp.]MBP9231219.1 oxygen-independent coproporphyrinogen III oxidase [Phenylobacterium sp.]MBP9755980.1 oxygen-independent coproporphyrinogen III oxidase [Phenylobacterium sp.]
MTSPSVLHAPKPVTLALDELIAKYDGRAPRYTSYPTAVQFTPQVDAATYRGWLAALPLTDPVSIYLHIPFCARLCWYCGCNTRAVNRHEPVSDYVQHLIIEAERLQGALPGRLPANAIHLGGGTPNMLAPEEMDVIFGALRRIFDVTPDAEIAAELDPAVLSRDWVRAAASHGLSRASLGVQNLAPQVQAAVNRQESFEEIAQCVAWLREFGIGSINLDLMYGLPHQTTANTLSTVDQIVTLRPERIALFGYAHVPWMKAHQQLIDENALPGAAARLDQSEAAAERLVSEGYVRIGLDHFALPTDSLVVAQREGRLRRNFQGYTTDSAQTLLGLGASSIGSLPQGLVQNIAQELPWRAAVVAGDLPIARGVIVTDEDRFRGEIIERLMCDLAVDLGAVCDRHGRTLAGLADELSDLRAFADDGLVAIQEGRLTVTDLGRLVVRSVCAVFDTYFAPEAGRHSKAL